MVMASTPVAVGVGTVLHLDRLRERARAGDTGAQAEVERADREQAAAGERWAQVEADALEEYRAKVAAFRGCYGTVVAAVADLVAAGRELDAFLDHQRARQLREKPGGSEYEALTAQGRALRSGRVSSALCAAVAEHVRGIGVLGDELRFEAANYSLPEAGA